MEQRQDSGVVVLPAEEETTQEISSKKARKAEKKSIKKQQKAAMKEALEQEKQRKREEKGKAKRKRRWRFGDRADGRKLRTLTPFSRIVPYIMQVRSDSQNHFEEEIDITDIETYLREKRKEGMKNIGILHIIIAAYVRAIAQRPAINRFVAGDKVYARNNIEIVMTIKKKLSTTSPDTTMKCIFEPTDTIDEVYEKWNAVALKTIGTGEETDFDNTAKLLNYIPGFFLKYTIKFLRFLDYFGLLPRFLTRVSPFHGSMVITSMGSLGIGPIYHHLYDFGNLPVFLCYGKKYSKVVLREDGTAEKRYFVGFRAVTDERICDGYYYASAFKTVMHSIKNPASLEQPPEQVLEDID